MTLGGTTGQEGSATGLRDDQNYQHGMSVEQQRVVVDAFKVCAHRCVHACARARAQDPPRQNCTAVARSSGCTESGAAAGRP